MDSGTKLSCLTPTKMTRWLSHFLVGRIIQVRAQGSVLSPLLFLIYMSMSNQNLTTDKTQNPSLLMTLLYGLLEKKYTICSKHFAQGHTKTGKVVCQMENKPES